MSKIYEKELAPLAPAIGAEARAMLAEFDATGVTFHDRVATLAALKEGGRDVVFDDGTPKIVYDGELLPMRDALLRYAYDNRSACDGRTLPRTGVGTSRPGLAAKSDFTTTREKLDYIGQHGSEAWERLPLKGASTSEVLTREGFLKLPRQERMRRYAADPDVFAKLAPAPKPRPSGAFINVEGIERQKATSGRR
jgi:hypothetical protein